MARKCATSCLCGVPQFTLRERPSGRAHATKWGPVRATEHGSSRGLLGKKGSTHGPCEYTRVGGVVVVALGVLAVCGEWFPEERRALRGPRLDRTTRPIPAPIPRTADLSPLPRAYRIWAAQNVRTRRAEGCLTSGEIPPQELLCRPCAGSTYDGERKHEGSPVAAAEVERTEGPFLVPNV